METLCRCAGQDSQGCSAEMRWKIAEVTVQRKPPELCLRTAAALQQASPRAACSWCPHLLLKLALSELCAALNISSVLGQGRLQYKLFGQFGAKSFFKSNFSIVSLAQLMQSNQVLEHIWWLFASCFGSCWCNTWGYRRGSKCKLTLTQTVFEIWCGKANFLIGRKCGKYKGHEQLFSKDGFKTVRGFVSPCAEIIPWHLL